MAKMKALLPTALLLGGAYFLPPTAFAQTLHDNTVVTPLKQSMVPNASTFDALLAVPKLIISDEDANRALKDMTLDKKGSGAFTWSARTGDKGNYTFKNVKAEDGSLRFETMKFSGLRMDGKDATFERLDLHGIRADDGKGGAITFDRVSMSRPSPEVVDWVATLLDDPSDLNYDVDEYEPQLDAFGAFYLKNLKLKSKEENVEGHVAEMGWGTSSDQKGTILIRDANISGQDEEETYPVDIVMGLLVAIGIDMDTFQKGMDSIDLSDLSGSMAKQDKMTLEQDPFSQKYEYIKISNFGVAADTAKIHLEDMSASQQKVGTRLSSQLTLKPLSFEFSGEPTDPELVEAYESLAKISFDKLSLTGTSSSTVDEATDSFTGVSRFDLVDMMSMGSSYTGNGFGDFMTSMRGVENSDDMTDEEAMETFGKLSLNSLSLSLRDESMIDKILSIAGQESGETPDMLKMKAKSLLMMGAIMAQNPSQMAVAGQASSAFTALLDEGGEVTISLNPDAPMTLETFAGMDLDNPKSIDLSELGITIEHKK